MGNRMGAAAYARIGVESDVMAASPHRLISLLFEGAIVAIRAARRHMENGQPEKKGEAVSRALDIVNNGLLAALDMERGGELSQRLAALYDYVARRLLQANLHNDAAALDEAAGILGDIGSAWRDIHPGKGRGRDEKGAG